ncbi:MAG TPA: ABC transporter permease [Polyangiaceae bacterium]
MFGNDTLSSALRSVLRHPGRTIMTVLGLTIGVGAFIAMVSFGEGARRAVIAQFEALGVNLLRVTSVPGVRQPRGRKTQFLTERDLSAVKRETTSVQSVIPVFKTSSTVGYQGAKQLAQIYGTTPRFTVVHYWRFASGGMFDERDVEQRAKVCVLGATPASKLFGARDALGASIRVGSKLSCRVIGVLAPKGAGTNGNDLDDMVLIPSSTYATYVARRSNYSSIEIEPLSPALLEVARAEVTQALRRTHGLQKGDFDDFSVSSPAEVVRAVQRTSGILGGLLQGIAAVSLLVGGIGIMNIQLVSVAERTKEIGIRSAIGGSPRQILVQFLSEALVLSLIGAAAGVALGLVVAAVVANFMGWTRVISPEGVLLSAAFGIAVGVVFGLLPARRAAELDPVEALRHE